MNESKLVLILDIVKAILSNVEHNNQLDSIRQKVQKVCVMLSSRVITNDKLKMIMKDAILETNNYQSEPDDVMFDESDDIIFEDNLTYIDNTLDKIIENQWDIITPDIMKKILADILTEGIDDEDYDEDSEESSHNKRQRIE